MIYFINDYRNIPFTLAQNSFYMPECERVRIYKKKKFQQSIYARYAAAYGLKNEYGILGGSISFSCGENGQAIIEPSVAYISLSHSEYAVLAAISDEPIGADIEKISDFRPKIYDKYFSPAEKMFVDSAIDKNIAFTKIWCLKESLGKLLGLGLGAVISKTDFHYQDEIFYSPNYSYFFNAKVIDKFILAYCSKKDMGENYINII